MLLAVWSGLVFLVTDEEVPRRFDIPSLVPAFFANERHRNGDEPRLAHRTEATHRLNDSPVGAASDAESLVRRVASIKVRKRACGRGSQALDAGEHDDDSPANFTHEARHDGPTVGVDCGRIDP